MKIPKLILWNNVFQDEDYLFQGEKLTELEKANREYKRKVLDLAKKYKDASSIEKIDRYYVPEGVKEVPKKYQEVDAKEMRPGNEQKKWEDEKLMQVYSIVLVYFNFYSVWMKSQLRLKTWFYSHAFESHFDVCFKYSILLK